MTRFINPIRSAVTVALVCFATMSVPDIAGAETLMVNGAVVRGTDEIFRADMVFKSGYRFDRFVRFTARDGIDQVMFRIPADSTLWVAYGRHMLLYADTTSRVVSASYNGVPAEIIYIDDENNALDSRPPISMGLVILLLAVVFGGLIFGVISGSVARRNLAVLGRNPMLDHSFYGFIVGLLFALLIFGLSERRFDIEGLFATYTEDHLDQFRFDRPQPQ
jgi:hypothetical protein